MLKKIWPRFVWTEVQRRWVIGGAMQDMKSRFPTGPDAFDTLMQTLFYKLEHDEWRRAPGAPEPAGPAARSASEGWAAGEKSFDSSRYLEGSVKGGDGEVAKVEKRRWGGGRPARLVSSPATARPGQLKVEKRRPGVNRRRRRDERG